MKKLFIIILMLFSIHAVAQTTAELYLGQQQTKVFLERTAVAQNSVTFGYLEVTYHGGAMFKAFHEQKFWDAPIYGHIEYQTTFDGGNVYLAGTGLYLYVKNGFFEFCPMYRYNGQSQWQASFVYLLNWKYIELYGYNHLWGRDNACFFGEERLHFKLGQHFRIGGAIDFAYFDKFTATPLLGIRYDF